MSENTLTIRTTLDEETTEFLIDGEFITRWHQEDVGWEGLADAKCLAKKIAERLGAKVVVEEVEEL